MAKRVVWGLVLGVAYLALCMQSLPWVIALFGVTNAVAQYEHCALAPGISTKLKLWHTTLSTLLFLVVSTALAGVIPAIWIPLALLVLIRIYLIPMVGSFDLASNSGVDHSTYLLFIRSLVIVTLPMACIPAIAAWPGDTPYFLLLIGASWGADTGAMFSGKLIGKTHPWPRLSPKKTAEGVVGGVLSAGVIWACLPLYPNANDFAWLGMATLGAVPQAAILFVMGGVLGFLGVYGDLTFSMFKREAAVKDYGGSIPGHGGVLDRFDSMLFVAPLMYLLCYLLS